MEMDLLIIELDQELYQVQECIWEAMEEWVQWEDHMDMVLM